GRSRVGFEAERSKSSGRRFPERVQALPSSLLRFMDRAPPATQERARETYPLYAFPLNSAASDAFSNGGAIQRRLMLDLIFVGSTIIFFLLALVYVRGCEKL